MTTTAQHWADLKRALIRELGREGAAEWLAHASRVMAVEAKRAKQPIEVGRAPHA